MEYRAKPVPPAPEKDSTMGPTQGGKSSLPVQPHGDRLTPAPEHFGATYSESCPDGDNPSIGGISADLPSQGDLRNKDTQRGSNPYPGKPGAGPRDGQP